jgi:hypothetical protein
MKMIKSNKILCMSVLGLSLLSPSLSFADPCTEMLSSLTQGESWRVSLTHANSEKSFAKSNAAREDEMKKWKADAEDEIHGRGKYNHSNV